MACGDSALGPKIDEGKVEIEPLEPMEFEDPKVSLEKELKTKEVPELKALNGEAEGRYIGLFWDWIRFGS